MAEPIVCPVCGATNQPDMEFCWNCQSRLLPLTGPLKAENAPIQPGEPPTKKVTSELEPLLPQWLREARQQARESAADDQAKIEQHEPEPPEPSGSDLLAGLASQSKDEEEEIPEWLARITGAQTTKKKPVPDDNQVKWVELGRGDEAKEPSQEPGVDEGAQTPKAAAAEKDELSDWFKQAAASSETADFGLPPAPPAAEPPSTLQGSQSAPETTEPAEPEDLGWLRNLDAATAQTEPPTAPATPLHGDVPDWLRRLEAEQRPPESPGAAVPPPASPAQVPDWLKSFGEERIAPAPAPAPSEEQPLFDQKLPDWLGGTGPSAPQTTQPESLPEETPFPTELPDWLSALGTAQPPPQDEAKAAASVFKAEEPVPTSTGPAPEVPDWVAGLGKPEEPPKPEEPAPASPAAPVELPDWISALGTTAPPKAEEPTPASTEAPVEVPDWMSTLGNAAVPLKAEEPPTPSSTELPDWISSLRAEQAAPQMEEPTSSAPSEPAPAQEQTAEPAAPLPAFADASSSGDVDEIFTSMQTPDWLSSVLPTPAAAEEGAPAAAPEEEPIGPAELPSWVQAMRPVESAIAGTPKATERAATEERGPLAGLQGVLPAIPGAVVPTSKPKAHSIKLDASEQQQSHAALLEQILAAETSPIPMKSAGALLRTQRVLRWAISVLLLAVLGGAIFGRTQSFQLPSGVPNETIAAIQAVENIPADAPVLAVFDYQASTVGEMEASGASLMDHLLLLKHPRIVLLSTSPTGAALAERFMSTTLASRGYARNLQYVDLGYLPGGLAGVYNFAHNPSATVPLDAGLRPVWQSAILAPVQRLSDFAAIIVLTDSLESGRTWVEQTQGTRGNSPMVFVASAQAGPMLLPYVDSGQVNGMVSGIYGAAGAEQKNAGLPGFVRRYWDAYSLGLYLAVTLILLGGLWNLWLGVRDRRMGTVG